MRSITFVAALIIAACGVRPDAGAAPSPTAAPSGAATERIVIEGDVTSHVVDAATGRVVSVLPGGVLAPSRDVLARVERAAATTRVHAVDLAGKPVSEVTIPGAYELPDAYGPAPSGFSPDGSWLVLVSRERGEARFAVVDVRRSTVARTVTLADRFSFDAIHNDASAMYLIEHPVPGSSTYNVRLYDLRADRLAPDLIFDKATVTRFDPRLGLMDGAFHVSVAPTRGDWSYGLYMRSNGTPFVHALNVPGRYATCILDIAGRWTTTAMFSMALSDDGRRLFVVDTVGGSVSLIDATTQKLARSATFATRGSAGDAARASAVLSRDGSRLYAAAPSGIAVLWTADLTLRGWLAPELAARSLAISSDGARVYALADDAVYAIDASSGRAVTRLASAPRARAIHLLPRSDVGSRP